MLNKEALIECLNANKIKFAESTDENLVKGFLDHSVEYVSKLGRKVKYTFFGGRPGEISSKITNKEGTKELYKSLTYSDNNLSVSQSKVLGRGPNLHFSTEITHNLEQIKPNNIIRNNPAEELYATYSKSNNFKQDALTNMVSTLIRL